jgi:hypothetical protein
VKYLILIHSNPEFRKRWARLTAAEHAEFGRGHRALAAELSASGELVAAEGLAGPERGRWVTVRDGRASTTDGPFAEVKEHLAGFYLVDCGSPERAVQIAAQIPDARWGLVEVRPVLTPAG